MIANENRSELLQSLKEGSFSAFEKLYNLYSGKLYNFMMRLSSGNQYMAEEVVQQTFIRLWEVREKVDPTENFVSYLCTIARNLSMNMYQHQTVEYIYTEYLLKSNPDRDHQTEESTDLRFLNDYIDSLAEELPPSRKKIFLLSKRQGYTNKEIAEVFSIHLEIIFFSLFHHRFPPFRVIASRKVRKALDICFFTVSGLMPSCSATSR